MSITSPIEHLTREERRAAAANRFLSSLELLVQRHRALALHSEHVDLHVELIAAEVAHELSVTRSALQRYPQLP
jgi:hypothetical protein